MPAVPVVGLARLHAAVDWIYAALWGAAIAHDSAGFPGLQPRGVSIRSAQNAGVVADEIAGAVRIGLTVCSTGVSVQIALGERGLPCSLGSMAAGSLDLVAGAAARVSVRFAHIEERYQRGDAGRQKESYRKHFHGITLPGSNPSMTPVRAQGYLDLGA